MSVERSPESKLPIAECRLDLVGLRAQRDRYRRLGTQTEAVFRERSCLTVRFRAGFDEVLLRETIAVERGCCPFFEFDYLNAERLLRIGVARLEQTAALDALAFAFRGEQPES